MFNKVFGTFFLVMIALSIFALAGVIAPKRAQAKGGIQQPMCVPVSPSCGCDTFNSELCRDPGQTWQQDGTCQGTIKWKVQGGLNAIYQFGKIKHSSFTIERCQFSPPAQLNLCQTTCSL